MKNFGGDWTRIKMEVVVKYAKAYLEIMKNHPYWHKMYFDALAGSGQIEAENDEKLMEGTAIQIMNINDPIPFNSYYFVDNDEEVLNQLEESLDRKFPDKEKYFVREDCNKKIKDLSNYLKSSKGKNTKVLGYFDPFGMQINWEAVSSLSEANVDVWMLVPTGIGVNRMLTKSGMITKAWQEKLENFLGLDFDNIQNHFYKENPQLNMFQNSDPQKTNDPIGSIISLYVERLGEVFKYISEPLALKNSKNSVMYHLVMMSNNKTAKKIADEIIAKY